MKTIQVRNVPDELSGALKAKAALAGQSLSDYLLGELHELAARKSRAELFAELSRERVAGLTPAAEMLAQERADVSR